MGTDFSKSQTRENLMRAFAGESMARNRYTFAASQAKNQNLQVIQHVFTFTAGQEKEHAEIFFGHLKGLGGDTVQVNGGYPVGAADTVAQLLRYAQHNEYEEWGDIYKSFGDTASAEGFIPVAQSFYRIAEIEKSHGERFGRFADLLEQGKLFVSDVSCRWMCLNCGHILEGTEAPKICPVCSHDRGYFIRLELAPMLTKN